MLGRTLQTAAILIFVLCTGSSQANSTSFCYQIPSKGDNLLYCNLTTKWEPRIGKSSLTAIASVLSVISGISTLYVLFKVAPTVNNDYIRVASFPSCVFCYPCYVIVPVLKLVWDGIDIMLDAYTFRQLESGKLIDSVIYRNTHVVNAILVFTIFGIVKLFFNMWLILKCSVYFQINDKDDMLNIKRATVFLAFLLEDGVELFLEYFWIEKYFTHKPPFYLVGRDVFIAIIVILTIILDLVDLRKKEVPKYQRVIYAVMLLIGVTELLRVTSAVHQISTLKLNQNCFVVENGRLYQTPFDRRCLKNVEYAILISAALALFSTVFVILIPTKILVRRTKSMTAEENIENQGKYDAISS